MQLSSPPSPPRSSRMVNMRVKPVEKSEEVQNPAGTPLFRRSKTCKNTGRLLRPPPTTCHDVFVWSRPASRGGRTIAFIIILPTLCLRRHPPNLIPFGFRVESLNSHFSFISPARRRRLEGLGLGFQGLQGLRQPPGASGWAPAPAAAHTPKKIFRLA